jgi:hypothetical protein
MASLEQARRRFILRSGLHAVFLVTPVRSRLAVPWTAYEDVLERLCREQPSVKDTLDYLGLRMEEVRQLIY